MKHYGDRWWIEARGSKWPDSKQSFCRTVHTLLKFPHYEDIYAEQVKAMKRKHCAMGDDSVGKRGEGEGLKLHERKTDSGQAQQYVLKSGKTDADSDVKKKVRFQSPRKRLVLPGHVAVLVETDSLLTSRFVNGEWQPRKPEFRQITALIRQFLLWIVNNLPVSPMNKYSNMVRWVPREEMRMRMS